MWEQFRAIANRIGLSRKEIEDVERGGEPTLVQYPLNPEVQIRVRPDPDWTSRIADAWQGELVNSRQQSAGAIPITDGRLHIGEVSDPDQGVTARVVAGEYEIVLTIAHRGDEASGDYEEQVSHAYALLRGTDTVALIEPMTTDDETEIFVEAGTMAFAGAGVIEQIAAEHLDGRVWAMRSVLAQAKPAIERAETHFTHVATGDGSGALISIDSGYGRGTYPLFRIADEAGNLVGVLIDFYFDNRPW